MIEILAVLYKNRYMVVIGAFLSLCLAFYLYHLKATIAINNLTEERNQLKKTVEQQIETLNKVQEDYKKIIKARDDLETENQTLHDKERKLRESLYRENKQKKSLEKLAMKKTSLIQKKINEATKKVIECFEQISTGGEC